MNEAKANFLASNFIESNITLFKLLSGLAISAIALSPLAASAITPSTASTTFNTSLTIAASCSISAQDVDFGTVTSLTTDQTASATNVVATNCTGQNIENAHMFDTNSPTAPDFHMTAPAGVFGGVAAPILVTISSPAVIGGLNITANNTGWGSNGPTSSNVFTYVAHIPANALAGTYTGKITANVIFF